MEYYYLLWIITAAIVAALPIIFIKQYLEDNEKQYMIWYSFLSYSILIYAYIQILKNSDISILYPIVKIISILLVVIVGIFLNKENFTQTNLLGLILGIIAILLLSQP